MRALPFLLCAFLLSVCTAQAAPYPETLPDGSINWGRASTFTALTVGSTSLDDDQITGQSTISGNFGVGGQGSLKMSNGTINGNLYVRSTATYKLSGPATVNGSIFATGVDNTIDNALADAASLSSAASTAIQTGSYTTTMGSFNGMTQNGSSNVTLNGTGKIVLNLQDFVMNGGTFTLQGTAMTTYIVNVSRDFSLQNARIVLSGGLLASKVLFNIKGSGSTVSVGNNSEMSGGLLALNRRVTLNGGKVKGRVISGELKVTGGGSIQSQ